MLGVQLKFLCHGRDIGRSLQTKNGEFMSPYDPYPQCTGRPPLTRGPKPNRQSRSGSDLDLGAVETWFEGKLIPELDLQELSDQCVKTPYRFLWMTFGMTFVKGHRLASCELIRQLHYWDQCSDN